MKKLLCVCLTLLLCVSSVFTAFAESYYWETFEFEDAFGVKHAIKLQLPQEYESLFSHSYTSTIFGSSHSFITIYNSRSGIRLELNYGKDYCYTGSKVVYTFNDIRSEFRENGSKCEKAELLDGDSHYTYYMLYYESEGHVSGRIFYPHDNQNKYYTFMDFYGRPLDKNGNKYVWNSSDLEVVRTIIYSIEIEY